ncbi:MAG: hypothetical protein IJD51_06705 [Clostridia bacterium]|nr:hypothetical protein [Clostridia bacterium]
MKRTKNRPRGVHPLRAFAVGLVISIAAFLGCTFIGALIVGATENPLAGARIGAVIAFYVGGAISGFCTAKYKKEGAVAHTAAASLTFCLCLFVIGLIISGGSVPALLPLNYGVYILISVLLALAGSRQGSRRH